MALFCRWRCMWINTYQLFPGVSRFTIKTRKNMTMLFWHWQQQSRERKDPFWSPFKDTLIEDILHILNSSFVQKNCVKTLNLDRFGSISTLLLDKGDEFRWLVWKAQGSKNCNVLKTFWHHEKASCQHVHLLSASVRAGPRRSAPHSAAATQRARCDCKLLKV